MEGIVNFLTWVGTNVVAPIGAALLFIGVAWFIAYKVGWSGMKKIAKQADADNVSIDVFRPTLIGYAVAIIGGILIAALGAIIVGNWDSTKDFVDGLFKELIQRTSYRYGPVLPMFAIFPVSLKEKSWMFWRFVRRTFRRR